MSELHDKYMLRCITLAKKGSGTVKANPLVGAVIVYKDRILGEGYHSYFGGPHAEVNAINSVQSEDLIHLPFATLYVSLEPCCIYGKTPPCTQKIIEVGIKKVVIGCPDPNPSINGKSIALLKANGINVEILEQSHEAENLIKKFKVNLQKRPYIILKWAQSFDGYIGHKAHQIWLTDQASKILVHKWRTEVDGILIGKNSAKIDNPQLTARLYNGENPVRIVLDQRLELSSSLQLFTDGNHTIVLNKIKNESIATLKYIKLDDFSPTSIANTLFLQDIYSVIIEGGSKLLGSFIEANLWDEARVFKTSKKLLDEFKHVELIPAPHCSGKLLQKSTVLTDELLIMQNDKQFI